MNVIPAKPPIDFVVGATVVAKNPVVIDVIPAKPPIDFPIGDEPTAIDFPIGSKPTAIDFPVGYPDMDVPCDASIPHPVDFCVGVAKKTSRLFSMIATVVLLAISAPAYAIS